VPAQVNFTPKQEKTQRIIAFKFKAGAGELLKSRPKDPGNSTCATYRLFSRSSQSSRYLRFQSIKKRKAITIPTAAPI
jgi:hypothetical protein